MGGASDSPFLQIIDGDGDFATQNIGHYFAEEGITSAGMNYETVAIMGCQSSGKSTLLNMLFKTKFITMDAEQGRTQTTRGVLVARAHESDILVMDLEGTDGRERGDSGVSFERKTALFALSLAEVVLVNLWFHDLGRYNAANYALLKTVFEVNLQLFQKKGSPKTLLLFVIRDHTSKTTNLDLLEKMIVEDMNKIWEQISKPAGFEESTVYDFFDFTICSLRHKELEPEAFEEGVVGLHDRFYNRDHPNYLFGTSDRKRVPGDGLSKYAEQLWDAIKENRDLDLPAQKELLALFRCGEISTTIYKEFEAEVASLQVKAESKENIENFGSRAEAIISEALEKFDAPAILYKSEEGYETKRADLADRLKSALHLVFNSQVDNQGQKCLATFTEALKDCAEKVKAKGYASVNFGDVLATATREANAAFEAASAAANFDGSGWNCAHSRSALADAMKELSERLQDAHVEQVVASIKELLVASLNKQVSALVENLQPDMWSRIQTVMSDAGEKAVDQLQEELRKLSVKGDEIVEGLLGYAREVVVKRFKEMANPTVMLYSLRKKFDEKFRYDANKTLRQWKKGTNVQGEFTAARQEAMKLLVMFSVAKFGEEAEDTVVICDEDRCEEIKRVFLAETETAFVEAKNQQERDALTSGLPPWVIGLICLLGFDEFMWILGQPFLLVLGTLIAVGGYVAYMMNMHLVVKFVLQKYLRQAMDNLPMDKIQDFAQNAATKANESAMAAQQAATARAAEASSRAAVAVATIKTEAEKKDD